MTIKSAIPALVLAIACTGCSVADKELTGYSDPGFGEANRATYAAMVVNPDPRYDTPIPASSADHAAKAIERYRTDAVKKPERITTTETIGGN